MNLQQIGKWVKGRNTDLWVSLFLIILSAGVISEAIELEVGTPSSPGSGFMIFGAASILGLLAIHRFIKSIYWLPATQEGERIHWGRIIAVILSNLLYIYFLRSLGYLICTFLLLSVLFQVLERGRWIKRIIGSALTSFLTYIFFTKLLQLNLPKGLIHFF